ncbi:MAG: CarD family transcriptional regulator, partial [Endozoicomonas sp.]
MLQHNFPLPAHPGDKLQWGNLSKAGYAYAIATAAAEDTKPLMIIIPDSASANRLVEELAFFIPKSSNVKVTQMPDWEILPYDTFSPHQDIISQRLSTLYYLPTTGQSSQKTILVTPVSTLMHRVCPKSFLLGNYFSLKPGDLFNINVRRGQLEQAGYRYVDSVLEHGEFAIRGSIVDIFPMGSDIPYRIDLFDDEIESLRTFDPETQRSIDKVPSISLLPGHEFPMDKAGRECFRNNFREQFDVSHRDCPIYQDIGEGIASPGIEYYLSLFFIETATLFDYLPDSTRILAYETVGDTLEQYYKDVQARYESRKIDPQRPILPPSSVLMLPDELFSRLNELPRVTLYEQSIPEKAGRYNFDRIELPELTLNARTEEPLSHLKSFVSKVKHVLLVAESAGRREVLIELLAQNQIIPELCENWSEFQQNRPRLAISIGLLEYGLHLNKDNTAVIPESLLLGQRVIQTRRRKGGEKQSSDQIIRNLTELRIGAPVVHIDHGVGRYQGLETLAIDGQTTEFLTLKYANEAKLYVPVASLHLISRYTGADDEMAPLHRLGSEQWTKARRKAAEKARDVAVELLDIYARRETRTGFAFAPPEQNYLAFSAGFPFEETPDQQQAIASVIKDMCEPKPMDRLVCGDVGFGKTEVAMRAAFLAAQNGKQVAILVPTTL